jgi:hypothetical protein
MDDDDKRVPANGRRDQPVMLVNQQRRTLPYGVAPPGPRPEPPLTERRTMLMRAPQLPGARPAPPPGQAPLPQPPSPAPKAVAAPCRPSRPTPRVQAPPNPRMRQVHRRSEVMDALRDELTRLRRGDR